MQVNFSTVDAYLQEIEAERGEIDGGVVRCEVEKTRKNEGVESVWLKSGFTVKGELRQLVIHCGDTPGGRREQDGEQVALSVAEEIAGKVSLLNLKFRRGVFV